MGRDGYILKEFVTFHLCISMLVCQSDKLPPKIAVDAPLAVTYTGAHSKHSCFQRRNKHPAEQKSLSCPRIPSDLNRPIWILTPFFPIEHPSAMACHARLALD